MSGAVFSPREARALFRAGRFGPLKEMLAAAVPDALAAQWPEADPFERIVFFKLLPPERAERLFDLLPAEQGMFLLGAVERGALGPVLEAVPPAEADRLFHVLPRETVRRMRDSLRKRNP